MEIAGDDMSSYTSYLGGAIKRPVNKNILKKVQIHFRIIQRWCRRHRVLSLLLLLISAFFLWTPWVLTKFMPENFKSLQDLSALGDTYGVFNALIQALAFGALIYTIRQQEKMIQQQSIEIALQKKAVDENTREVSMQKTVMNAQLEVMRTSGQLSALPALISARVEALDNLVRSSFLYFDQDFHILELESSNSLSNNRLRKLSSRIARMLQSERRANSTFTAKSLIAVFSSKGRTAIQYGVLEEIMNSIDALIKLRCSQIEVYGELDKIKY